MAWDYSEKTKQLFLDAVHGKPGTHLGEIKDPDGLGEHGSIACGDSMRFTFRCEKDATDPLKDKIVEAKFLTFGCTSAIAASEALCIIIEARKCTPIEALAITNQDIVDFLEGLPTQKIHCSVMGAEALTAAVYDWAKKRGVSLEKLGVDVQQHEQEEEGRLVCKCFNLTEPYLRRKIKELNLRTVPEITAALKAGGACTTCINAPGGLQDILDDVWGAENAKTGTLPIVGQAPVGIQAPTASASGAVSASGIGMASASGVGMASGIGMASASASASGLANLSPFQFSKQVESVLEKFVRPILQQDGGDIESVDIKGNLIYVSLHGACSGCMSANETLKGLVENVLRERVQNDIRVIQI